MRAQAGVDLLADRREEVLRLDVAVRRRARIGESRPGLCLQRQLTPPPGPLPGAGRRLIQREFVWPRGETPLAAEVVELAENRHERVVGALLGDVPLIAAAELRKPRAAAAHLEAGRAQQQVV